MSLKKIVKGILATSYEKRLLIYDTEGFIDYFDYTKLLGEAFYSVVFYDDVEEFRLYHERKIRGAEGNWAIIVSSNDLYVPFDIRKEFYEVRLSLDKVFPKFDKSVVRKHIHDLDIIGFSYDEVYGGILTANETEAFFTDTVLNDDNVHKYLESNRQILYNRILSMEESPIDYLEWMTIAKIKASIEVYAARAGLPMDLNFIDDAFAHFILGDYSMLSGIPGSQAPVIIAKALDHITGENIGGKSAIIVMDGMSLFDFNIISRYFKEIQYDLHYSYALIPTTTAISRQSLLSGQYPRQLDSPFSLANEEKNFYDAVAIRGYSKKQVSYVKGYNAQVDLNTKYLAVIINDIDDIVHGQQQGRPGMYNDMQMLGESGKIQALIKTLHDEGFTVYMTSDHGNTLCRGVGGLRTGVEIETKSKRMLVYKDFADISNDIIDNTFEYPGYYLDKGYRYLICKAGISFDNKNKQVMTHGGISIDEVIVPFIKIKAVE